MTDPLQALVGLSAKWREPQASDECTLYTMGQRAARQTCADELGELIRSPAFARLVGAEANKDFPDEALRLLRPAAELIRELAQSHSNKDQRLRECALNVESVCAGLAALASAATPKEG